MSSKTENEITISVETSTIVRAVVAVVGALLALLFIQKIASALVLIFISFFLALALNPAVSFITKKLKSNSRIRATGAAYLLVLAFLVGFFSLILPPLIRQTIDFLKDVPQTIETFKSSDTVFSRLVSQYDLSAQLDSFAQDFGSRVQDISEPALTAVGTLGTVIFSTVTVMVLTFMMLVEGPAWLDKILAMQPKSKRTHRKKVAYRLYKVVTGYVNGQLAVATLGGFFSALGLVIFSTIFDVSVNAIALGGIVALFALLPMVGTTIGATIVVLACLFVSTPLAISMAIFFVVYQQIENVTIQPYIQSRTSQITPLMVLSAALIGATFGGLLGALVAIPVASCLKILVEEKYRDRLKHAEAN